MPDHSHSNNHGNSHSYGNGYTGFTFEALKNSTGSINDRRRLRLEDMTSPDEQRIPLKPEKMARKDSRLALRNLFGRSKSKEVLGQFSTSRNNSFSHESTGTPEPAREITSKASGILRGAFADLSSNWGSSKTTEAPASAPAPAPAQTQIDTQTQTQTQTPVSVPVPVPAPAPAPVTATLGRTKEKQKLSLRAKQRPAIVIDTSVAAALQTPVQGPLSPPASVPIPRVPSTSHHSQSQLMYKTIKTPIATWDPPPLFRAYPQAIRHSRLPAATMAADSLLRFHEKHGAVDDKEPGEAAREEGSPIELRKRKSQRRNHHSNALPKFDWTHKIYVLVTSGYLLQYSGDGAYDRLPEKVLHLGKESAAFATDIFPGKHWVLQVSATMDAEGTMSTDSRSLLSRLLEKRHANNCLMVFENGDDMNVWINVLRREIATLGGKEILSETGQVRPTTDAVDAEGHKLRAQGSQRALVVRDPARFSRGSLAPDQLAAAWPPSKRNSHCSVLSYTSAHSSTSASNRNSTSELSIPRGDREADDVSTTNSFVSQDGRQLDNLRDGNCNRLSVVSAISAQRTVLTSAGSSPVCSPRRDSFTANCIPDEALLSPLTAATSRAEKRQSVQSVHSLGDKQRDFDASSQIVNFSVPNSSGRRFSVVRSPSTDTLTKEPLRTQSQRKPLPTLPTLHDTPPAATAMRSPTHIAQCLSPIETPSSPSYALHSVPSRRSSRTTMDAPSLRMFSGPVPSTPTTSTPRRHNSSRLARTASFSTVPRPQSMATKCHTHIAALASPTVTGPSRPGSSASHAAGALKLRSAPPVSMDKLSLSPKKTAASVHPSSAAGRERRRSFVLEASEVSTQRFIAQLSPLPSPDEPSASSTGMLAAAPTLSTKSSLSALLPQRSIRDVLPQPPCSVHGGLPPAGTGTPRAPLRPAMAKSLGRAQSVQKAHRSLLKAASQAQINRRSLPTMTSPPPAPPPTRALPPLPVTAGTSQ